MNNNLKSSIGNIFSKIKKNDNIPNIQKKAEEPVLIEKDPPVILNAFDESLKNKKVNSTKGIGLNPIENTVISKEAEVNGSITSRGNITVNGRVKGNLTSESNIKVTGSVEGDIQGKSVEILNGNVLGNIKSESSIIISDKSAIEGDIECDRLELNGNVTGNAQVHSSASLGKETVIFGNLTTQNLSIQEGAIVNGAVKVSKEKDTSAKQGTLFEKPNTIENYMNPIHAN